MDRYESASSINSFSYRKMSRRIRQAMVSTKTMCEHRKDISSSALIYKQYRQPIWRLKLFSSNTDDKYLWPKSRRIVNLLSDPYRKLYRNPVMEAGYLFTLPITSNLRTRPKLSLHDRRPLRCPPSYLKRLSPPRLVVPPAAIRRYQVNQPNRTVYRDYSYVYDNTRGPTRDGLDLDFKSRLLSRTSAYAFPIIIGEMQSPRRTTRLADKMCSTYANRSMEDETSSLFKIRSKISQHSSGYKYAEFIKSPKVERTANINNLVYSTRNVTRPIRQIEVPKTFNNKVGRWSKPFLPNAPIHQEITKSKLHRRVFDKPDISEYVGLCRSSPRFRETELASIYKPRSFRSDLNQQTHLSQRITNIPNHRYSTTSELLPVKDDIALRLRLSARLSPSTMAQLYPNDKLILGQLPIKPSKNKLKDILAEEEELLKSYKTKSNMKTNYKKYCYETSSSKQSTNSFNSNYGGFASGASLRSKNNSYHLYPSDPPKLVTHSFTLRPLPGTNLKLKISRVAAKISSKFDEEESTDNEEPRLMTSANNYSQLYVAHPEYLPTSELGQRLKLSLRSSTSKIASMYASHPVPTSSLLPARMKYKRTSSLSHRIPDKYLPDSYVPRPGIVNALRVRPNLHGLA